MTQKFVIQTFEGERVIHLKYKRIVNIEVILTPSLQKLTFDYEGTAQISGVVKFIDYIIKNAEKLKNGELDQAYLFKLLEKVPDTDSKKALGKNNG